MTKRIVLQGDSLRVDVFSLRVNVIMTILFLSQQIQQQVPPTIFVPGANFATHSPSQNKSRSDSLRELACADTSGIGSSNTSPRQSSRPNSVPSGNGSVIVQPLDDHEVDIMDVKKEQVESPNGRHYGM